MNFQEFEEVFSQIVRGERRPKGKWLTPLYSSSSLYALSESPGKIPPYIPVSSFQRVFVSNEKFQFPPGFYQCRISGREIIRYIESLTNRGYRITGYHIAGPDGRYIFSSGFPELSDFIISELGEDRSLSAENITFAKGDDTLTFDSRLQIHISSYHTDLKPIFDLLRMHEGLVQGQRDTYENLSNLRISGDLIIPGKASPKPSGKQPYVPGYETAFTKMIFADTVLYSIHERSNPLNWVRILETEGAIRFVRGIHCSFDFFTTLFQNYGGIGR